MAKSDKKKILNELENLKSPAALNKVMTEDLKKTNEKTEEKKKVIKKEFGNGSDTSPQKGNIELSPARKKAEPIVFNTQEEANKYVGSLAKQHLDYLSEPTNFNNVARGEMQRFGIEKRYKNSIAPHANSPYLNMDYRTMTDDIHNTYGGELRRGNIDQSTYYKERAKYDAERISKANEEELKELLEEKNNEREYMKFQLQFTGTEQQRQNALIAKNRIQELDVLEAEINARIADMELDKEYDNTLLEFGGIAIKSGASDEYIESKSDRYILGADAPDTYLQGLPEQTYTFINLYKTGRLNENELKTINGEISNLTFLTDGEVKLYNTLYNNNPEDAENFLRKMEPILNKRLAEYESQKALEYGQEHPYLAGLKSVVQNVTTGLPAAVDNVVEGITGKVDTYDATSRILRESQALRQGGSEYFNQKYGEAGGFLYNTGVSIVENLANVFLFKGAGNAASRLIATNMAGNAAANGMINVADKGGSDFQIITSGLANGAAEYLFEKFSVEKLFDIKSARSVGDFVKATLAQSGIEASEEIFTETANILTDAIIMQEKSENSTKLRNYIMQGMSSEEASKKVFHESITQIALAGASGFLSGGVMGGGATLLNNASRASYITYKGEQMLKDPRVFNKLLEVGIANNNAEANYTAEMISDGLQVDSKQAGKMLSSVIEQSIENDGGMINIMQLIGTIEGRGSSYIGSTESIDTAKAVMHMVQGKATEVDNALLQRSDGAVTLLTAIEGNEKAWDKIKEAAGRELRSEAQMQNTEGRIHNQEDFTENATVSDGEIYSGGKKLSIPEKVRQANNIILDENSSEFRNKDAKGYKVVETLAKDLKKKVKFVKGLTDADGNQLDGAITEEGIYINTEGENPVRWAATHEFSHAMKQTATGSWSRYQNYVVNQMKRNGSYDSVFETKAKAYSTIDANYINEEIAADYIGDLFSDVDSLADFIRESRRDAVTIRDMWYSILDKLGLLGEKKKAQLMWRDAYREAVLNVKEGKVEKSGEVKKSFAGVRAQTSDVDSLNNAQKMEREGKAAEEIWQKTGWGRGLDGKWRFEIDDFESYLIEKPNLKMHYSDEGDYYTGKLVDVFNHKKLFEAYPHLKETKIVIQEKEPGVYATAFANRNEIVLSKALFERTTEEYKDLLNNRQKYIDEIEQTPEYRKYNSIYEMEDGEISPEEWLRLEAEARKNFFETDLGKRYYVLRWGKVNVKKYELGWTDKAKEVLLHEIQHLIQHEEGFAKGSNPSYWKGKNNTNRDASDLYKNTAGEIEARAVQERRDMTEEERRNTYPESFKTNDNVVFADAEVNYDIVTLDNGKTYVEATRQVITGNNIAQWRKSITAFFNSALKNGDINITATDGTILIITKDTAKKARDNYKIENGKSVKMSDGEFLVKLHAESHIDELAEIAKKTGHRKDGKKHSFAKNGFDYKTVYFKDFDNSYYEITLSIGLSNGISTVYNVGKIKTDNLPTGKIVSRKVGQSPMANLSVDTTVSQNTPVVNNKSMQNGENNSQKSISGTRASEILSAENAELRAQMENMTLFNVSKSAQYGAEIRRAAQDIKSGYGSKINVSDLQKELGELYNYMVGKDTRNDAEVRKSIHNLAEKVIAQATETVVNEEYSDLLDRIKTTRILVPESERTGFRDGYEYFRKHTAMGKITLANEGIELDVLWEELCNEYPQFFDENMTGSEERLERILEVREEIGPTEESIYHTNEEYRSAVLALENDILESFYNIPKSDGGNKFMFYAKRAPMSQKALEESKERATAKKLSWNKNEVKKRIDSDYRYLYQMINNPTDARHVPEDMRGGVAYLLDCFRFETVQLDRIKAEGKETESPTAVRLEKMYDAYRDIIRKAWGIDNRNTESNLLDEHLSEDLQELRDMIPIDESGEFKRIQDMSIEELRSIAKVLTAVHHSITQRNKAFNSAIKEEISELGANSVLDMQNIRNRRKGSGERLDYNGIIKAFDKYLNFDNVQPWDFFHGMGGTMERLYMEERKAFNRHIDNIREASKVLQKATEGLNLKKLTGKNAGKEWFKLDSGEEIRLTKGQILSIYALYQRGQGKEHILGGGIVTNAESKNERGHKSSANNAHRVTEADLGKIFETLSEDEKRMVGEIARFLSRRCAEWGNETSMKLYGYEKYGEGWYFPIKVSNQTLNTYYGEHGEGNLRSQGFTKKTVKNAKNAVEIGDFFDVATNHINGMSLYNTVAIPMLDLERVLNYSNSAFDDKVRGQIVTTFGKAAEKYIEAFHKDVNGSRKTDDKDKLIEKLTANTKRASIGLNARVLLQQPTSIARIFLFMNPRDIPSAWNGVTLKKEMQENIPIAYWKSLGFRDIGTGSTMKEVLLDNESLYNKAAMGGYGMADDFTWSLIYGAVKNEIARKNPSLDKNSAEFIEKVRERFDYIVDRSQVVDSVFHRTQIMRSGNAYTKTATMFMSEPLKTFNMYRTEMLDAIKNGEVGKKTARATAVFVVSNLLLSIAQALPDMWREDDEKELFKNGKEIPLWDRLLKKFTENIIDNSNPMTYLPYVKDIWSMIQGYTQERVEYSNISDLIASSKGLLDGRRTVIHRALNLVKPASAILGISAGNLIRDTKGIYDMVYRMVGDEYADYMLEKFSWNVKNEDNKSKFMKHYKRALQNGHSEDAATILADYMAETFDGHNFENKYAKKVIGEMSKLYGKTEYDSKLFYDLPKREFSFDKKNYSITDGEYPEYVEGAYKTLWDMAYEMVTDKRYKELSDEDKVRSFGEIKDYAQQMQRMETVDGYELSGWEKDVYSGEMDYMDGVLERKAEREYQESRDNYRDNFEYDESKYSPAEIDVIEKVGSDAASYYAAIEKDREYNKKTLRHIEVYDEKLSDEMPIEEYAGVRAYAKKTAAMADGKESMKKNELINYLNSTDYSLAVKRALFEAIGNSNWKNPY